jgi:ATP-dependent protease Clp ATPase subunit
MKHLIKLRFRCWTAGLDETYKQTARPSYHRHDVPELNGVVLREQKQMEGTFEELRKQGAPDQSSGSYSDVDTTSQLFQVGKSFSGMALQPCFVSTGSHLNC